MIDVDSVVVIHPGDKLVLHTKRMISAQEAHDVKERIADRLPGIDVVIVSSFDQMVVYRGEGDPS